jgi:hypothetical protein
MKGQARITEPLPSLRSAVNDYARLTTIVNGEPVFGGPNETIDLINYFRFLTPQCKVDARVMAAKMRSRILGAT